MEIILKETGKSITIIKSSALNKPNYGNLQGLNKTETEHKYGDKQVLVWRRSFDITPSGEESLKDTFDRIVLFDKKEIEPNIHAGKNLMIVAHGNSFDGLMMYLHKIHPRGNLRSEYCNRNTEVIRI